MMPSTAQRIYGLVRQELYLTRRRMEIIMDILFFPMINVVLFGYITHFVGSSGEVNADYLILGILLWEVLVIMQYNVSVSTLWNIWSHNLTNVFIAPISSREYLTAQVIAAALRTFAILGLLALGTYLVFGFNVLSLGWGTVALCVLNLTIFACSLGFALLGAVFRFGTRVQSLTWYTIFLFQPLTAAFFPVHVLPGFLQPIAYAMPPTYVFEGARQALVTPSVNWRYALIALGLNVLYFVLSVLLFRNFFRKSKESGQFARNDL